MLGWLSALARRAPAREEAPPEARVHVVLLDGTLSSLEDGHETSIGLIWKMLEGHAHELGLCLHYEPGIAWRGWRHAPEIAAGVGVNAQLRRAYHFLARTWAPGDPVFLVGYSRGAYVARALAGMIDRVGLLTRANATEPMVATAFDHYRDDPTTPAARRFRELHCHDRAAVTAVACFDTVRAVGLRWPLLWRLAPPVHAFRSHRLGPTTRHGLHALALHETRKAFAPDLWTTRPPRSDSVEQVWFRGAHADIGGQVGRRPRSRPLANVPLVWMLERMAALGLTLPDGWRDCFPTDARAPSIGSWRGFGPVFLDRATREMGTDPSERLHPSAKGTEPPSADLPEWLPPRGPRPTADPRPRGYAP